MFDPDLMGHDHPGPTVTGCMTRISSIAQRHARLGAATQAEKAAGAAEL
jgi:hypothetical protein